MGCSYERPCHHPVNMFLVGLASSVWRLVVLAGRDNRLRQDRQEIPADRCRLSGRISALGGGGSSLGVRPDWHLRLRLLDERPRARGPDMVVRLSLSGAGWH